jgi:hypothetical protein
MGRRISRRIRSAPSPIGASVVARLARVRHGVWLGVGVGIGLGVAGGVFRVGEHILGGVGRSIFSCVATPTTTQTFATQSSDVPQLPQSSEPPQPSLLVPQFLL